LTDVAGGLDTERVAVGHRRDAEIRTMIEALTPTQRDVLLLRIFGGLTVDEVAAAVGRRAGAVKGLQRRGLESIRRRLQLEDVAVGAV
jgi:RNA polymerase sigma-70 factor (ECF subfamily)